MIKIGYDISLIDKRGNEFKLKSPLIAGGTIELGGNKTTTISVTYNYAWFFYKFFDNEKGIRWLYGRKAKDCTKRIQNMIDELMTTGMGNGEVPYNDYWAPTPGNVKKIMDVLLDWCKEFPEGTFNGD